MAARGVFFILSEQQAQALLTANDDEQVRQIVGVIEDRWDLDNLVECDKAWDAMHRLLTDGELDCGNGRYPWNQVVLGPKQLHEADDYFVSFVSPEQVRDVASALQGITQEWFAERYRSVVPSDYALEHGNDDLEYTWAWFQGVRDLYAKAAARQRAVVFTVDQ
jgi:hypothetical protein